MSEYDGQLCLVPLDYLQRLRAMDRPRHQHPDQLKDYAKTQEVVKRACKDLRRRRARRLLVSDRTWEEKQGPLLAAIDIEKGILNVLLFMIIAVAGFGILAIFSMIVVEKTRDIGILKALGASNRWRDEDLPRLRPAARRRRLRCSERSLG